MKQVAFVNEGTGEIAHILSPGRDADYLDGLIYGGLRAVDIAHDADATLLMTEYCWLSGDWFHRGKKPAKYYTWNMSTLVWEIDEDTLFKEIRAQRDYLLKGSDWTQMPDVVMDETKREEWRLYRQALRDVPGNSEGVTSPEEVSWPTPPV